MNQNNSVMDGSVSNLLEKVNLIRQKYDDLAEYTGENFNVFDILGVYQHELKHSAFIGNLLNVKGKHGQKDVFLKLFIDEIKDISENNVSLEDFITAQSRAIIEMHDGRVNLADDEGGRIDIFITDGRNELLIENKIWAGDQEKQLSRYYRANRFIIYLTLDGKEPGLASCGDLKLGEQFICVSYKEHIVNWLEKCIKEMANKPIIRETLNQYLYLVKQLTNQTPNNKMSSEIIDLMLRNENSLTSAKIVKENYEAAIKKASLNQTNILHDILKGKGIDSSIERAVRGGGDGLFIPFKELPKEINGKFYELGVNIELNKNFYFFCVAEIGKEREYRINNHSQFSPFHEWVSRVFSTEKLEITGWTVGVSNSFIIGINKEHWFLPETDNTEVFEKLALTILDMKERVCRDFQD